MLHTFGLFAISALVTFITLAFAPNVAPMVRAAQCFAGGTSESGCALTSAIVAFTLARAVVGACLCGAVSTHPSISTLAFTINAAAMTCATAWTALYFAFITSPWGNAIALPHAACSMVVTTRVDTLARVKARLICFV